MTRDGGIETQIEIGRDTGMEAVRGDTEATEMIGNGDGREVEDTIGRGGGGDLILGHDRETGMTTVNDDEDDHLLDLVREKGILKDALDTGADHHVQIVVSKGRAATSTIPDVKFSIMFYRLLAEYAEKASACNAVSHFWATDEVPFWWCNWRSRNCCCLLSFPVRVFPFAFGWRSLR